MTAPLLSVVIPAFNEARRLPATLARLREHLAEVPVVWRNDAATRVSLGGGGTAFLDLLRIRASAMRGHYGPAGGGPPT